MPLRWRLQVLEADVRKSLVMDVSIREVDLLHLQGSNRTAALDAMVAGSPLPYVLCDGKVLSTGDLSDAPIISAIRNVLPL